VHDAGASEPLLVAQLDAAQVQHAVLHCSEYLLSTTGAVALEERRDDSERQM
jgi:hypothetical protein